MRAAQAVQAGPSGTACVVRVGDVRFWLILPDCARRNRNKCNRSRGAMLRKSVQWSMDPESCMRRYISVLRLNRPESAIV
jgi:hypothetical protein